MFGNDIESLRIAFGTIFGEVVGWEFICQNGDIYNRSLMIHGKEISLIKSSINQWLEKKIGLIKPSADDLIKRVEGDGLLNQVGMTIVGSEWKIEIKFTFTWPMEKDRCLPRIYWCKLPEAKIFFTTDPEYVSCLGKRIMCLDASFDEESRLYVGKLHEEMPMLQETLEVLVADCSKLLHRRPFFKLSEVVLEFGNRMNGGIEQALHKIEEPKHRTERVFRVFKGMFQPSVVGNIQIPNLEDKVI